jgi:hypothetical protein
VKRKGYHREVGPEGSVEQTCESKRRKRRTSGQRTAKSISIKDAKRRSDDYARKAAQLTPGDLLCVAVATEAVEKLSERGVEVSKGRSRPMTSAKLVRHSEAERRRNG